MTGVQTCALPISWFQATSSRKDRDLVASWNQNYRISGSEKVLGLCLQNWEGVYGQLGCICMLKPLSHVWFLETHWTVAHQTPLSMAFFRQEYWSELPFPPPGGSSQPRDQTCIYCASFISRRILYHCTNLEVQNRGRKEEIETRKLTTISKQNLLCNSRKHY